MQSLTSGKISSTDLSSLIQVAGKYGVKALRLNGLEIEFFSLTEPKGLVNTENTSAKSVPIVEPTFDADELRERVEANLRGDQLTNLIFEDPVAYDRLMMSGELLDREVNADSDEPDI